MLQQGLLLQMLRHAGEKPQPPGMLLATHLAFLRPIGLSHLLDSPLGIFLG